MPQFLVEAYVPAAGSIDQAETIARLQAAATELTATALSVSYVRSSFVPTDEAWLRVFEASSADTVEQVGRRARLTFDRVTEAVEPVAHDRPARHRSSSAGLARPGGFCSSSTVSAAQVTNVAKRAAR